MWATIIITVFAILALVVLLLLLIPTLARQAMQLVEVGPQIAQNVETFLTERFPSLVEEDSIIRRSLNDLGETIRSRGGELVQAAFTSLGSLVNIIVLFVIVPVVSFYLLMDWDRMVAQVDSLLPREHAPTIRRLAGQIDATLAGFIRGQGLVCLILGTYYAIALMAVGLQFGLVIGFVAGALTFIPYVGAIVGGVMAIGLALFQFWGDWVWIVAVWAIFQSGQFIEGNILTPKLVGSSVGLHPVWLIFALSAFGALFGFVGLLVAVPIAAVMGVLARFVAEQYRASKLYRGLDDDGNG
jgi:predicted PurR-regulated permease PerM